MAAGGTQAMRRFVYLVVKGCYDRRLRCCRDSYMADTFHMRRINVSRFFFYPKPPPPPPPAMVVDARLPRPCITFCAPSVMHFMLLGRNSDKVLAVDHKGRTTMYDPAANTIRAAPTLAHPKRLPAISLPIGDDLYILDPTSSDHRCFEALVYKPGGPAHDWVTTRGPIDRYNDWHCQSLPPPPYHPYSCSFVGANGAIGAYAVVGGGGDSAEIWVSTNDGSGSGTFSFDTARRAWTKHGDWTLPFRGLAEYVPEYNLWFALSSGSNNNHLCAFDLAGAAEPPATRDFCQELKPPKDWKLVSSHLVHLGSGRFCIARFFDKPVKIPVCCVCDMDTQTETYGVFTGVEVKKPGRGLRLRMVKHRSECYRFDDHIKEWVL
ncbi:uncharacterized protein LOC127764541 [Oryza glaberrima]|uniref:DUF1618 domain-containing protein n=1 Tax=Oryza glaberrima TaxID=4538 RepID=I1NX43_ORYGL|nr:uncharacterized protein LOC127764541 [Oryza glaberrima]